MEIKLSNGYVLKISLIKNNGTVTTKIIDFVEETFMKEPTAKGIQISVISDQFKKKGIPVTNKFVVEKLRQSGYSIRRGLSGKYFVLKKIEKENK